MSLSSTYHSANQVLDTLRQFTDGRETLLLGSPPDLPAPFPSMNYSQV